MQHEFKGGIYNANMHLTAWKHFKPEKLENVNQKVRLHTSKDQKEIQDEDDEAE